MQAHAQPIAPASKLAPSLARRVTPLGYQDKGYFFLSKIGDMQRYAADDLIKRNGAIFYNLFSGDFWELADDFPRYGKDGDVVGVDFERVGGALMRECHRLGLFDSSLPVRRNGIWRRGDRLIVHSGDQLHTFIDGQLHECVPSGRFEDRLIYPSAPLTPIFGQKPAATGDITRLIDELDARFAFLNGRAEAEMAAGYILASFFGAAHEPRPHCFVSADAGTGKSTFLDLVQSILGGACADKIDNATGAGLMQKYSGDGRLLLYDELEREEGQEARNEGIMMLVRLAFSGEGAKTVRGSAGGKAMDFNFSCPVLGVGILPPMIKQQDWSRFVYLTLGPRDGRQQEGLGDMLAWARQQGPDIWRLMLQRWPVFLDNLGNYRREWERQGATSRQAAVYAVPLAALSAAQSPDPAPQDLISQQIEGRGWLHALFASQNQDTEAMDCITYLLTKPLKTAWRQGVQLSVGQAIADVGNDGINLDDLQSVGLKYNSGVARNGLGEGLIIANTHVGLRELFAGTRWQDKGWAHVIARLPGAVKLDKTVRVGGVSLRAMMLPAAVLATLVGKDDRPLNLDADIPL